MTEGKDTDDNYFASALRTQSGDESDGGIAATQEADDIVYSDADTVTAEEESLLIVGGRAEQLADYYRREVRIAASPPSSDDLKKTFLRWSTRARRESVAVAVPVGNVSTSSSSSAPQASSSGSDVVENVNVGEPDVEHDVN